MNDTTIAIIAGIITLVILALAKALYEFKKDFDDVHSGDFLLKNQ